MARSMQLSSTMPLQRSIAVANPGLVNILDTSYAEEDYAIGMAKGLGL